MSSEVSSDSRLLPEQTPAPPDLADVIQDLASRPSRPPDYEAENRALAVLASELAEYPENMLQRLTEIALVVCGADTAGISLLETHDGMEVFRWEALAGAGAAARNMTMPRAASPCGVCIAENKTTLLYLPERCFPALPREPRFVEVLLIPFHHQGQPIGTVWAIMHQFDRKFDREDERLIRRLAAFASAGWQLWKAHTTLEQRVAERTAELSEMNAVLQKEIEERRRLDEERKTLLQRVALTQEEERSRIARELHDDLAQRLALLEIELERVRQNPPGDPEQVAARLYPLTGQVEALANDLRELSHRLHPSILEDLGLEAALRAIAGEYDRSYGRVRFAGGYLSRPVPVPVASALYRVTQEALRNAAKHAPRAATTVTLCETPTELRVTIHDDGPGFDPDAPGTKGGLGIVSMQERMQLVDGKLVVESRPGAGTEIRASVFWQQL